MDRLAALERENAELRAALRRLSSIHGHIDARVAVAPPPAAPMASRTEQQLTAAAPVAAPVAQPLAAPTHEEQLASFREKGFLLVDGVLESDELRAVQRDFAALSGPLREQWEAGVRDNELGLQKEALYVRNALEHSDALLGLIDRPKLLPLLTDIIGGDVQLRQVQVQSVMPTRDEAGGGYVNWHRDKGNYAHSTRSIWVKAFIYFSDVPADGGCTTVVPRTQNLDDSPPAGSYRGFGSSDGLTQEQMPGVSTQRCGASSL